MKFEPLFDNVTFEDIEEEEVEGAEFLYRTSTTVVGKVTSVGPDVQKVTINDIIVYDEDKVSYIDIEEVSIQIIKESEILGVMK